MDAHHKEMFHWVLEFGDLYAKSSECPKVLHLRPLL